MEFGETLMEGMVSKGPAFDDFTVVGGGILGLSTGMHLLKRFPGAKVRVIEKEQSWASHQTGNNSGVIHSGIYYKPGSFKARFAREGSRTMVAFCKEHGIPHDVCGKVIIATRPEELPLLENLYKRGLENGLPVTKITAEEVKETEPHVACLGGIRVPTTGITSYRQVSAKYAELIREAGGELTLGTKVEGIIGDGAEKVVSTTSGDYHTKFLINCGGLHSDRLAKMDGEDPGAKIVPFRGEYYELAPERRSLVKTLIYPVPNPAFPFLGVHFTRMIDGSVHAGPNAVLAFKREGYRKSDFDFRDFAATMMFGGFWKLAKKHFKDGAEEMHRSFSKAAFVRSLQQLIPEVTSEDLVPCHAGVRAQALMNDGNLVDDFLIINGRNSMHVCNAPSPAATASLEIGKTIASQVPDPQR